MNVPWLTKTQPGGFEKSLSPEATKFVAFAFLPPPNVLAMTLPNASNAALISGEVHFCWPATHLS